MSQGNEKGNDTFYFYILQGPIFFINNNKKKLKQYRMINSYSTKDYHDHKSS